MFKFTNAKFETGSLLKCNTKHMNPEFLSFVNAPAAHVWLLIYITISVSIFVCSSVHRILTLWEKCVLKIKHRLSTNYQKSENSQLVTFLLRCLYTILSVAQKVLTLEQNYSSQDQNEFFWKTKSGKTLSLS